MTQLVRRITPRARDLGGFTVQRVLPVAGQRAVGPFVFLDQMGPSEFAPGEGVDVRPHPHIGLATVTWLYDGELTHHDTVGAHVSIRPGALNVMTAGRGVTHSERTSAAVRAAGHRLYGLQIWMALPQAHEADPPRFQHISAGGIPQTIQNDTQITLILGEAFGLAAPAHVSHPCAFADLRMAAGAELALPDAYPERAVYVLEGEVAIGDEVLAPATMGVVAPGAAARVTAGPGGAHAVLLAGAALDGPRTMWWNFVHSDPAAIEAAKRDWAASAAANWVDTPFTLPDGESEYIPLPDGP